jgi:hypothetical protein
MVVTIVNINTGQALRELRPIDDPDAEIIMLEPAGSSSGIIDLNDRFPGLDNDLRAADLACFWAYRPQGEFRQPLLPIVGATVLRVDSQ